MSTPPPAPDRSPNTSRSDFIRRLSYFLIGTAIGLFLLGIINQQRARAKQAAPTPASAPAPPVP